MGYHYNCYYYTDEIDLQYIGCHWLLLLLLLLLHRWVWSAVHRLPLVTTTTTTTTQVSLICSIQAGMGYYYNCYYYTDESDLQYTRCHGLLLLLLLLLHRWVWSAVHRLPLVTTTTTTTTQVSLICSIQADMGYYYHCYYYTDEFDLQCTGCTGYYYNWYYYTDESDLQYTRCHGLLLQQLELQL